jgi:adenylyltransferase/sulfurtransferase
MSRTLSLASLAMAFAIAPLAPVFAAETPAAWEAMSAYLESLPPDFNGIRGEVLKAKLDSGEPIFLLDVRERNEFAVGHIESAVNVPVREVPKSLAKLPQDKNAPIVIVCAGAVRSGYVVMALKEKGYSNVKHLAQGFVAGWQKAGYSIAK